MGSAFTSTLANIFMWKWENELIVGNRNSPNTARTLVRLCPYKKLSYETTDTEKSTETDNLPIQK